MNQKRQPKGVPVGGQFAENGHDEAMSSLTPSLSSQEPTEIDAVLSDLYQRESLILHNLDGLTRRISDHDKREKPFYTSQEDWDKQRERLVEKSDEHRAELAEVRAEGEPYHEEFTRRGGWTRAFLVTGSNGHVHKSMDCSTCFPTTRYYWVTDMSGQDESEIVDAAGEKACTVCYPSAPVDTLRQPSRIEDPAVVAEREKRAAEKAARDAVRAEKGITDPATGGDLIVRRYHIKTALTAEREAIRLITTLKHDSVEAYSNQRYVNENREDVAALVRALANKRGETFEETVSYLDEKAKKKFRKESSWFLAEHGLTEVPDTKVDPAW